MTNPFDADDLQRQRDEADRVFQAIDQQLALTGAAAYLTLRHPDATLIWGNKQTLPTPDTLDQVWQLATPQEDGGTYIVVAARVEGTPLRLCQFTSETRVQAGSVEYLMYGIRELRSHGYTSLADTLHIEWKCGRLHYLFIETQLSDDEKSLTGLRVREFDIATSAVVDPAIVAIRRNDGEAIETLRHQFDDETLRFYVAQYWQYTTWEEKSLLIFLVQDNNSPLLLPIMEDALDMPDIGGDAARAVHVIALIHLENDFSRFETYFYDDELATTAIAAWKQQKREDTHSE